MGVVGERYVYPVNSESVVVSGDAWRNLTSVHMCLAAVEIMKVWLELWMIALTILVNNDLSSRLEF